jgi:hypothetical protein
MSKPAKIAKVTLDIPTEFEAFRAWAIHANRLLNCNIRELADRNTELEAQVRVLQESGRDSIGRKAFARVLMIEDEFGKAIMDRRHEV